MPTAVEVEIRCERCAQRHPDRKAPLLATLRGSELLEPIRLTVKQSRRLGVPRSGLFWRRPVYDLDGRAVLRCRRCGQVRYLVPA